MAATARGEWFVQGKPNEFRINEKGRGPIAVVTEQFMDRELRAAYARRIVRSVNLHDELVAVAQRVAKNGECTCTDGGAGFQCDVCEAKAVLKKAEERP